MQCPRCRSEIPVGSACPCEPHLELSEEPSPIVLDRTLDLDRAHVARVPEPVTPLDARDRPTARAAPRSRVATVFAPATRPEPPRAPIPPLQDLPVEPSLEPSPTVDAAPAQLLEAKDPAWFVEPKLAADEDVIAVEAEVERAPVRRAQRVPLRAPGPEDVPAARRAAAWGVDAALLTAAAAPPLLVAAYLVPDGRGVLAALGAPAVGFALLLAFTYAVVAHAVMGATIGKRLLGLRVTGPDGRPPSLSRSAVRSLVAVVGGAALGVGVLAALFTKGGRAAHDVVTGTSVVAEPTRSA